LGPRAFPIETKGRGRRTFHMAARTTHHSRTSFWPPLWRICRLDEARAAAQAGLALDPTFTIDRFRAGVATDNPTYLSQRKRLVDGMSMVGVPE
jgi:hypothetical protein